jgi:two-component system, cell cycle sensor histidine kinase and response regulator CckA
MAPAGRHAYLIRSLGEGANVISTFGPVGMISGRMDGVLARAPSVWGEMIHPADRPKIDEQLQIVGAGAGAILRYRLVHHGETREVEEHLKVLSGVPLRALSAVYNVTDVTDVTEVTESEDQGERTEILQSTNRRMETLGEITAGVVHDVNGLFSLILTAAELARDSNLPEAVREEIDAILAAAVRGGTLFRGLLDFVSGGEQTQAHPVDLTAVVRTLEPILRRFLGEDVRLAMDLGSAAWPVMGIPSEIEQILLNLTANACDAMPRGGHLGIATRNVSATESIPVDGGSLPPGDYVCLEIADTGTGIAQVVRERLFERYVSTKATRGSGFGLSTVKRIVEGHGGGVQVLSAEGQGTRFLLHFPAHIAAVAGANLPTGAKVPGDRTVLLALPDANLRAELEHQFKQREWRVIPTMTARGALTAYDRARPRVDLVVTSAVLPDRNGHELQEALRRRTPDLRVLTLETILLQKESGLGDAHWYRSIETLLAVLDREGDLRRNG